VPVTVSIGVAALDNGSRRELTELLAAADAALYRAKASGRDQVQMISTSRGLSAVRPPADEMAATAAFLRDAQLPVENTEPDGGQLPDGAGLEDAAGDDSTASTSAFAV
jgi:predicted signal transduction protein with EAL and GGDEF domain